MNKYRFLFIILIVGIYYAYTEMKKTYKVMPTGSKPKSQTIVTTDKNIKKELQIKRSESQKSEVFYFVIIDRFFDENKNNNNKIDEYNIQGFHGGDLEGITEKLSYIKNLGVTSILLSNPMLQNKSPEFYTSKDTGDEYELYPYIGNAPIHLTKVDPNAGTEDDVIELIDKAHKNGLKVYMQTNISEENIDSEYLKSDETKDIFDKKSPICKYWSDDEIQKCVSKGKIRFDHKSKVAQNFIFYQLLELQIKTNIDGLFLKESRQLPSQFTVSLFDFFRTKQELSNFRFILSSGVRIKELYQDLFKVDDSDFYIDTKFTKKLINYLSEEAPEKQKELIDNFVSLANSPQRKFLITDFTATDSRSIATLYKKNYAKMIKHLSILGFMNVNLLFYYGEETGAEFARFPFSFQDMPWKIKPDNIKYNLAFKRIMNAKTKTKDFNKGYLEIVYNEDGLTIIAKKLNNMILGYLALNETNEEKTVFYEIKSTLRSPKGKDIITNSQIETLDNGITFTLDPNGVQFITF